MGVREKLVELLDNFHRDLSPFAGNEKLFVVDDNVEQAEYLIEHGVTVQEWIPVTERLPENIANRVLVVCERSNGVFYAHYEKPFCTACKRKMNPSQYGYAFCSLCGAKMDGGVDGG